MVIEVIYSYDLINVRSGVIDLNLGSLRLFGNIGNSWSRIAKAYSSSISAYAYILRFDASTVSSSYGPDNRWGAFPVRCLVILDVNYKKVSRICLLIFVDLC